jgi:hypothetical protein
MGVSRWLEHDPGITDMAGLAADPVANARIGNLLAEPFCF